MNEHERAVEDYPDWLLKAIIADIGRRGRALADYRDHEMRWLGGRAKGARAVLRTRKGGQGA